jgi:putative transposase
VSTRTYKSIPFFGQASIAVIAKDTLMESARRYAFAVLAYCFMPDHAHVVLVPSDDRAISAVMRIVKGAIARKVNDAFQRGGPVWQTGFFDKVPQSVDELNAYVRYVEDNPVVAGIVTNAEEYAFSSARGDCREAYFRFLEGVPVAAINTRAGNAARTRSAARAKSPRSMSGGTPDSHERAGARAESPRSSDAGDRASSRMER